MVKRWNKLRLSRMSATNPALTSFQQDSQGSLHFFVWMLHGSTKGRCPGWSPLNNTNHVAVSRRVQGRVGVACSSDG